METKVLQRTAGITRLDRIRKETTRQRFGVARIAEKLREIRIRWFRHVRWANDDAVRKIGSNFEVPGARGRPKQRWLDTPKECRSTCRSSSCDLEKSVTTLGERSLPPTGQTLVKVMMAMLNSAPHTARTSQDPAQAPVRLNRQPQGLGQSILSEAQSEARTITKRLRVNMTQPKALKN
ncbi:unnamed protein product [Heligmosomoides polygyrus]|uniref:Uncharacterized protein n=1 Tax=Heligmosomoides polygyrus TaxID=6339 RepID=A0A183FUV3_HELPZ|nr:unnamed protein product [Heligmosomoides polygyrus]